MAQRVPLPKYTALPECVLFHREHPADPQIVLQIPNADKTATLATHVLYLDRETDAAWMEHLTNGRALLDQLKMERHVAYYFKTGHFTAVPDLDEPGEIAMAIAWARVQAQPSPFFDRQLSDARRAPVNLPGVSPLRRWLGSRIPGGGRQVPR